VYVIAAIAGAVAAAILVVYAANGTRAPLSQPQAAPGARRFWKVPIIVATVLVVGSAGWAIVANLIGPDGPCDQPVSAECPPAPPLPPPAL